MIRILHRGCGGHLFDYAERPRRGMALASGKAVLPDGSKPALGSPIELRCQRCGHTIRHPWQIEPEGGYAPPLSAIGAYLLELTGHVHEDEVGFSDFVFYVPSHYLTLANYVANSMRPIGVRLRVYAMPELTADSIESLRYLPCGHLKGNCTLCHQCLLSAGKTWCPACEKERRSEHTPHHD